MGGGAASAPPAFGHAGELGPGVVAVGSYWREGSGKLDAVVLAGRDRRPILIGEAKWARTTDARRVEAALIRKAEAFETGDIRLAIAAREQVQWSGPDTLAITAADVFGP